MKKQVLVLFDALCVFQVFCQENNSYKSCECVFFHLFGLILVVSHEFEAKTPGLASLSAPSRTSFGQLLELPNNELFRCQLC